MVLHNCQSPADRHATLSGGFMSVCAIANECVAVLALQTLHAVVEDLPSMLWWRCDDGGRYYTLRAPVATPTLYAVWSACYKDTAQRARKALTWARCCT